MAALDYALLESTLVTLLQADARLAGVTVSADQSDPTAEICPFVGLAVTGFDRVPTQLTGSLNQGGPYLETVTVRFDCWEFSGQGGSDARRLLFALVDNLLAVLQDNPTLGGTVLVGQALRGQIETQRATAGITASLALDLQAQKFTP